MASVSSSHLVLFIAAIVVAAAVAGTVTNGAVRVGGAIEDDSRQYAENVDAEIQVISDAGSPDAVYDNTSGTLTLYVKNVGAATLPGEPGTVTVLVNGTLQTDVRTTVLDGESWRPGNVLRVRVDVSLPPRSDTRVVVTPTGARDRFRFRTPPADASNPREVVYATRDGSLRTIDAHGSITRYDATAAAIGPKEVDLDDDGRLEVPYVDPSGALRLVDDAGGTATLVDGGVETNKTLLAVGEWDGATSVFYVNETDNSTVYRVRPGSSPTQLLVDGNAQSASAVAGVADVNGDGDDELVYTGTSQTIHYVDGGQVEEVVTVGQNDGIGVGAPRQFDADPPARIPAVDTSNNRVLYDSAGNEETLEPGSSVGPVAGADWRDSDRLQYLYVVDGDVRYVTLDGTTGTVAAGVNASTEVGVA